jgi:hypothetical protein
MSGPDRTTIVIEREDLRVLAQALMLRLPLRAQESRRVARMRELLDCSAELTRVLAAQTHSGRVNCHGSHGIGDLEAETDALIDALAEYATILRDVAAEHRAIVTRHVDDVELSSGAISMPIARPVDMPIATVG